MKIIIAQEWATGVRHIGGPDHAVDPKYSEDMTRMTITITMPTATLTSITRATMINIVIDSSPKI